MIFYIIVFVGVLNCRQHSVLHALEEPPGGALHRSRSASPVIIWRRLVRNTSPQGMYLFIRSITCWRWQMRISLLMYLKAKYWIIVFYSGISSKYLWLQLDKHLRVPDNYCPSAFPLFNSLRKQTDSFIMNKNNSYKIWPLCTQNFIPIMMRYWSRRVNLQVFVFFFNSHSYHTAQTHKYFQWRVLGERSLQFDGWRDHVGVPQRANVKREKREILTQF